MSVGASHRPLRDVVCDEIRAAIIRGTYSPGSRLIEDQLAHELGVSRNPVREALRVLEVEGFVANVPRKGATVAALKPSEVEEIFEVRIALEALAARLAARRAGPADVEALRSIVRTARQAIDDDNVAELTLQNSQFHEKILDCGRNDYLREMMLALRGRLQWIYSRTAGANRGLKSLDEHSGLVDAIASGDEDEAARLAGEHVMRARQTYLDSNSTHV